jgi:hypothetical protein
MMVDLSFLRSAVRNGPRLRPSAEADHYSLRRGIERRTGAESIGRRRQRSVLRERRRGRGRAWRYRSLIAARCGAAVTWLSSSWPWRRDRR